ncbi:MAG TPA: maleylpyruvate isomerase family mycothiol-dependent enzyme [Trebonia sp.]|nr:maleylpyruvate isomerase family mycothiol-dependent enzyme [Trebonia sp.]
MRPEQTLDWMRDGTERLLGAVAALDDADLDEPCLLPGWNRRYLLSHLAANAGALRNLVYWARTGEERRMYASPEQRDADITAGARRPAGELRAWVASSADALAGDLATLPEPAWDAQVITAQGITRSAAEIPWMRAREVFVHAVDLACGAVGEAGAGGAGFADQPAAFLGALLDDVTARRGAVGTGPALVVSATDTGGRWQVAGAGAPTAVSAPLAVLAAWLTGRPASSASAPALRDAPALPPWL